MFIKRLNIALYSISFLIIFSHLWFGLFISFYTMIDSYAWLWIRIGYALHLIGAGWVLYFWKVKICPIYNTSKAPIFIVTASWYSSIPLFIAYNQEIISYKYLCFNPISPMVLIMITASIFFIWFWDEIKNTFGNSWCE